MRRWPKVALILLVWGASATAEDEIEVVLAHPLFDSFYSCSEHWHGQFSYLGDALGKDCTVKRLIEVDGRMWTRAYTGEGTRNDDWFGWHTEVLSPCTCEVIRAHENKVANEPGKLGKPPASFVVLRRDDGVHFMLAHIRNLSVAVGDRIEEGKAIASVGNNGYSRTPHVHIGAWREDVPVQIRFDQRRMQLPPEFR